MIFITGYCQKYRGSKRIPNFINNVLKDGIKKQGTEGTIEMLRVVRVITRVMTILIGSNGVLLFELGLCGAMDFDKGWCNFGS